MGGSQSHAGQGSDMFTVAQQKYEVQECGMQKGMLSKCMKINK